MSDEQPVQATTSSESAACAADGAPAREAVTMAGSRPPLSGASQPPRTLLQQAEEATDISRRAFASGNLAAGIGAITLASQLLALHRALKGAAHG